MMIGAMSTSVAATMLGSSLYSDVKVGSFYDAAVGAMSEQGIIKGYADGTFKPNKPVTRAELAVMFKRLEDQLLKSGVSQPAESSKSSSSAASVASASASSATTSSASSSSRGPLAPNPQGYIRFTSTSFSINESLGTVNVTFIRTNGNQGGVSVDYALVPGTAVAGTDYVDATGTLTFDNKQTSQKLAIQVKDDGVSTPERTFTVVLKDPKNGAGIASPTSTTVRILDKFYAGVSSATTASQGAAASSTATVPNFSLSASAYGVGENAGSITVTVVRTGVTTTAASVNYASVNGTATGNDATQVSGKLDFAANETSKTFTVPILDDTAIDGGKTVTISLSSPTNGAILVAPSAAQLSIYDNESMTVGSGTLKLSKSAYEASTGAGKAVITVLRVGGTIGTASVSYGASGGSGVQGTDYIGVAGTMTFAPGEASKTFTVPIMKTTPTNTGRTVGITLTSPTGAALGDPSTGVLTLAE